MPRMLSRSTLCLCICFMRSCGCLCSGLWEDSFIQYLLCRRDVHIVTAYWSVALLSELLSGAKRPLLFKNTGMHSHLFSLRLFFSADRICLDRFKTVAVHPSWITRLKILRISNSVWARAFFLRLSDILFSIINASFM